MRSFGICVLLLLATACTDRTMNEALVPDSAMQIEFIQQECADLLLQNQVARIDPQYEPQFDYCVGKRAYEENVPPAIVLLTRATFLNRRNPHETLADAMSVCGAFVLREIERSKKDLGELFPYQTPSALAYIAMIDNTQSMVVCLKGERYIAR